jgi:hypothetical protein
VKYTGRRLEQNFVLGEEVESFSEAMEHLYENKGRHMLADSILHLHE